MSIKKDKTLKGKGFSRLSFRKFLSFKNSTYDFPY